MRRSPTLSTPYLDGLSRALKPTLLPAALALVLPACGGSREPDWEAAHCVDKTTGRELPEGACAGGTTHGAQGMGFVPIWIYGGLFSGGYYSGGGSTTPLHSRYATPSGQVLDARPGMTTAPQATGARVPSSRVGYSPSGFGARGTSSS